MVSLHLSSPNLDNASQAPPEAHFVVISSLMSYQCLTVGVSGVGVQHSGRILTDVCKASFTVSFSDLKKFAGLTA